jgi:hypothetical protein
LGAYWGFAFGLSLTGGGFGLAGFCGEVVDKIGDKKVVRFELEGESVSDHRKTYFFERPPDRATASAPKAQSSVRLSVRAATAHNLTSTHRRARLNLPPAPDVAQLPGSRQSTRNGQLRRRRREHFEVRPQRQYCRAISASRPTTWG